MGRELRLQFLQTYKLALVMPQNAPLTYAVLTARGQRVQAWPAHY
jgi:hypothetical protein